jgi:hypothetical protein
MLSVEEPIQVVVKDELESLESAEASRTLIVKEERVSV